MSPYATLPEMLAWRARETPAATAFSFGEAAPTFAELWREIERFAAVVAGRGLGRGDRVLLALPNGPEFFAVFYGIQRAGATAVPVFADSGADRLALDFGDCGLRPDRRRARCGVRHWRHAMVHGRRYSEMHGSGSTRRLQPSVP